MRSASIRSTTFAGASAFRHHDLFPGDLGADNLPKLSLILIREVGQVEVALEGADHLTGERDLHLAHLFGNPFELAGDLAVRHQVIGPLDIYRVDRLHVSEPQEIDDAS